MVSKKDRRILQEKQAARFLKKHDILMGRGCIIADQPGNKLFRTIVESNKDEYKRSPYHSRSEIAKKVISDLQRLDPPARFVEKRSTGYVVVSYTKALEKTMQALREKPPAKRLNPEKYCTLSFVERPRIRNHFHASYFPNELAGSYFYQNARDLTSIVPFTQSFNKSSPVPIPTSSQSLTVTEPNTRVDTPLKSKKTGKPLVSPDDLFCDADESYLDTSIAIYYECLRRRNLP